LASALKTANLIQDAVSKNQAQKDIAEVKANTGAAEGSTSTRQPTSDTQPSIQPVAISDWLHQLDDPLNTELFRDLAGYLKSLRPSDDPQKVLFLVSTISFMKPPKKLFPRKMLSIKC
jgi:hypothetical protein